MINVKEMPIISERYLISTDKGTKNTTKKMHAQTKLGESPKLHNQKLKDML